MARMIEVRILHHRIPNTSRGEVDPQGTEGGGHGQVQAPMRYQRVFLAFHDKRIRWRVDSTL